MATEAAFPGYRTVEFRIEETDIRYLDAGSGFPLLLMHGVGPGTSCIGNFTFLLGPLAERFHVFAMDLAGFGLSGRKPAPPYFDFEFWTRQAQAMLARLPDGPVGVFGHSLSGALGLRLAARNRRVVAVATTGSVGTRFRLPQALDRLWSFPETRDELRTIMATIICDTSKLTDAMLDDRLAILHRGDYRAYFKAMFGPDRQHLVDSWALADSELAAIAAPVLMIHGRNDAPCPAEETTLKLAAQIPQADVLLLGNCSHSPSFEYPEKVGAAVQAFFAAHSTRRNAAS